MLKEVSVNIQNVVNLARNEETINIYEGFKTINPRGFGYFLITNYRFIFFKKSTEWSNKTVNMLEIPIEHIGGIKSEYGRKSVKIQKIIAFVVILLSLVSFGLFKVLGNFMFIVGGVLFVTGLLILLFSRRRVFTIEIFTKSIIGSIVSLSNDFFKLKKETRIVVRAETGEMIRDLGKTILEAQKYKAMPLEPVLKDSLPKING
ncbi:MAG: hypothetical protein M0R05_06935 [Bacilli bacterium]|nr:hypothetical protein [Bacilli bacterium]MDD4077402.1 hypothetical protein [Bacilli bacterium]MDD4389081.1 hypothetical protein [Bacilli bacterium]